MPPRQSPYIPPPFLPRNLLITKGVGVCQRPDEHIFFSNVLIGLALKSLYTHFPNFNWFSFYEAAGLFLAYWAFLASLVRTRDLFKVLLFGIGFLLIGSFYSTHLNYTFLSGLLFQGGLFLWATIERSEPLPARSLTLIFGGLCFFLSSLMRFEAFGFAFLTTLPFILWRFLPTHRRTRIFPALLATMFLVLSGLCFDHFYYQNDLRWKEFSHWLHAIHPYHDWRSLWFDPQTKPYFDAAGWSQNDLDLFNNWYFWDKDKFSAENIARIGSHFPSGRGGVLSFVSILLSSEAQTIFLCALTFLLFGTWRSFRFFSLNAAWVLGLVFLMDSFAWCPDRVYLPAFSFLANLAIYFAVDPGSKIAGPEKRLLGMSIKGAWVLLGLLTLLSIPVLRQTRSEIDRSRSGEALLRGFVQKLSPQADQLYVAWSFPYEIIHSFDDFEIFRNFHIFGLTGFQRSPFEQDLLSQFKVNNPWVDLIDSPNKFLLCDPLSIPLYQRYLLENFRKKVIPEPIAGCHFFFVFKIHSLQDPGIKNSTP